MKLASGALHLRFGDLVVAGILLVALLGTWGIRQVHVGRVQAHWQIQQDEVAADALTWISQQVDEQQQELLAEARLLVRDPDIIEMLRVYNRSQDREALASLVQRFDGLEFKERWSAELFDDSLRRVAWHGPSMPVDADASQILRAGSFRTALVQDSDWRKALAIWMPVQDGIRTIGALRVMVLVEVRTPIQNQYLRNFTLARQWRWDTGMPVQVHWGVPTVPEQTRESQVRLLHGLDGEVLGHVEVVPPDEALLIVQLQTRYNDVLSFWLVLLLGGGIAWVWSRYLRAASARPRPFKRRATWFVVTAVMGWGVRYGLLYFDIPARWQRDKAPLSPLFDPSHFASTLGGGILRSSGDFLLTALFALLFALGWLHLMSFFRRRVARLQGVQRPMVGARTSRWVGAGIASLGLAVLVIGGSWMVTVMARRAVLDSTLDYFARSGLLPEPLVIIVCCALLLVTLSVIGLAVGWMWLLIELALPLLLTAQKRWGGAAVGSAVLLIGAWAVRGNVPLEGNLFVGVVAGILGFSGWLAVRFIRNVDINQGLGMLTLRSVLPTVFFVSLLLYPLFYSGVEAQRRLRMVDAAETFDEGRDPRVIFAIEQLLQDLHGDADVRRQLRTGESLDSLATELLRGSLLTALGGYDVSLTMFDSLGVPVGRYDAAEQQLSRTTLDQSDALEFDILRRMYVDGGQPSVLVEQVTGRREPDRLQYEGVTHLAESGWVMARAEPQTLLQDGNTPFPRVLLPATFYGELAASLSMAEFYDGVLVRSFGRDFGRYRLDDAVLQTLRAHAEVWQKETVKERQYLTYYKRPSTNTESVIRAPGGIQVVAVRSPAVNVFDHLYYLLRLTVAGLCIGIPFNLFGLWSRYRLGQLPATHIRFRDKVLNAFLGVGIIAVAAVGLLGVQVVTGENERAVQSWLRQHLQDVEETLVLDAQGSEMPYRVLQRTGIDSVAARVGLDLNLYAGAELIASSRPQLVRERLIDPRLPIAAYQALYFDGYQFTYVEEQLGSFAYTAGYYALLDEEGAPRFVVSVPTLPEQERIEEERARTLAYLFGALLLLLLVVMGTASLLANALTRPIARLRVGLEEVAQGRFEQMLPVDTRDEIGELVQTFNTMQGQLAESRRQLAQQERQLAWREMARQVAHEIKNPLTPMKLSVQHLRRAYDDTTTGDGGVPPASRFTRLFDRVTNTLIEQIETLVRIANEFSTFARMPKRVLERLDLNTVVREAVDLMQAEAETEILLQLHPEPLVVEADHEELRRVYINLIKNALQALPEDQPGEVVVTTSPKPPLPIAAGTSGGFSYSTVQDTGTGISPELRDKIFQPNFSTKTSGTGLGLAITKKSLLELEGDIGFTTQEGQGTTFWLRLPLADRHL